MPRVKAIKYPGTGAIWYGGYITIQQLRMLRHRHALTRTDKPGQD